MDELLIDKTKSMRDRTLIAVGIVGLLRNRMGEDIGNALLLNSLYEFLMDAVSRSSIQERRIEELQKEIEQLKSQQPAKTKKH